MGAADVIKLAGDFGPMGLMVAYLVWRETRAEKVAQAGIEAQKALASSLALLEAAVRGLK
jgi:hypothetical protein